MKHAYLIIAHNDQLLLECLLDALVDERNSLFVHIDAKSNSLNLEQLKIKYHPYQVWFYKEIKVLWGQESQVECELFLLDKALTQNKHDYYHIISGTDYPIRSLDEIDTFFEKNYGKEFVHFDQMEADAEVLSRVYYLHPFNKMYKITRCKMIHRLFFIADNLAVKLQQLVGYRKALEYRVIQKGCNWCSITQQFAEYVISNKDKILAFVRGSRCADEVFIQTLVVNSRFEDCLYLKTYDNNYMACLRFIIWDKNNKKSPKTLDITDYTKIRKSKALYGRKFSSKKSWDLILRLQDECQRNLVDNEDN